MRRRSNWKAREMHGFKEAHNWREEVPALELADSAPQKSES